jgi:hypothetical protein
MPEITSNGTKMAIFPDLNAELGLALQLLEQDPAFFEDPDAPYSPETRATLKKMVKEADGPVEAPRDKWDRLERETQALFDELKDSKDNLSIEDHAERMSYFRTATSLMDKLVGLQERAVGLRAIGLFHQTVLDIMEDILDAGQRTEVMNRLQKIIRGDV